MIYKRTIMIISFLFIRIKIGEKGLRTYVTSKILRNITTEVKDFIQIDTYLYK